MHFKKKTFPIVHLNL